MGLPLILLDETMLDEKFDGTAINTAVWTVTDSENKMSVANSRLSFAGGKAAPSFADPSLVTVRSYGRTTGLIIEAEVLPTVINKDMEIGWCDGALSAGGEEMHAINFSSGGAIIAVRDPGANPMTPYVYVAGTSYLAAVALKATGALLYLSNDGGNTWDLVWLEPTITTSPVYGYLNNYNHTHSVGRVRIYRALLKGAVIDATPSGGTITAGGTLVTNGTMEADANWASVVGNEPTTNERSNEQAQGGTYSRKIVASAASQLIQSDVFTSSVVLGQFYKVGIYAYPPGTQCNISLLTGAGASLPGSGTFGGMTASQWNNKVMTYCEPTGGASARIRLGSVAAGTWYFDTVTNEPLTFSTLLSTDSHDAGSKQGIFDFDVTVGDNLQAGGVICLDSATTPANYLMCFLNTLTAKAELWKCESGTLTSLMSGSVTPTAGQTLRVVIVRGTSGLSNAQVALYYNTVKVGTTQTVNLSSGYGTLVRAFQTATATVAVEVNV